MIYGVRKLSEMVNEDDFTETQKMREIDLCVCVLAGYILDVKKEFKSIGLKLS